MKNITLSVDEEVLAAVRRYAVEHNQTVNGLVRDYLNQIASRHDRGAKARQRLLELSEESEGRLGSWKWNRDDLYDRGRLHRHEHPDLRGFGEGQRGVQETEGE